MNGNHDWMTEVMDSAKVSPDFRERCERAALLALDIARLRDERERVGFVALPFRAYLEGLGKIAGVSLAPLLTWFGIEDLSATATPGSLARLARELGLSAREAVVLLRVTTSERLGGAPILLLAARRRGGGPPANALDECDRALRQVESEYPPDVQAGIRHLESEVGQEYER